MSTESKDDVALSIIIPIYNAENYLERTVQSVINSGLKGISYELILINDGSTDSSLTICQSLQGIYEIIKVYSQDNKGLSEARNLGLAHSQGTFVWFVDSDDYIRPGSMGRFINKYFDSSYDILGFGSDTIREVDIKDNPVLNPTDSISWIGSGLQYLNHYSPTFVWTFWYKRSFVECNSLAFIGYGNEDVYFNTRLFLLNPICKFTNLKAYCYIDYSGNSHQITKERNPEKLKRMLNSYLEYFSFVSLINTDTLNKDAISRLYDGQLVPFVSRVLQANLSFKEWCKIKARIIPPKLSANVLPLYVSFMIRFFLATPFLYHVFSIVYRKLFIPIILDKFGRN